MQLFHRPASASKLPNAVLYPSSCTTAFRSQTPTRVCVSAIGISLQAMDSSHVALVTLNLSAEGFEEYRCDKSMTLGVSISNLAKVLRCGGNEDSLTLSCEEDPSKLKIKFENNSKKNIIKIIYNIYRIEERSRFRIIFNNHRH
jgi:proliferating cell nuclear antigen